MTITPRAPDCEARPVAALSDLVAEIAARYGASVKPGATVQRIATGVSGRPLPYWDGKTLVVPDWKEHQAAAIRASWRQGRRAGGQAQAKRSERMQKLCEMHDAGARVPAMAAALGISRDYVYSLLSRLGRKMERDPAQYVGSAKRMIAARKEQQAASAHARCEMIRGLAARGASEAEIAEAIGVRDRNGCRKLIRRAVPDFPFVSRRRGPAPKPADQRAKAQARIIHQARNAEILRQHRDAATVETICDAMGLRRLVVVRVLLKAGEVPRYAVEAVYAAQLAELPDLVARGMKTPAIAARWGKTVKAVHVMASRSGVSLRPTVGAPHNKGKVSETVARRREWIAAMVRRGAGDAEMLKVLKIHGSTLSADIKALGLSGTRPVGGKRVSGVTGRAA